MKTIARNILWRWFFLVFIIVKLVYNNIKHYNARINIVLFVMHMMMMAMMMLLVMMMMMIIIIITVIIKTCQM